MIKIYVYLILYSFHVLQTTTINKNYLKTFDQTGIMPTRISYPEQLIKTAWVKTRHCGKLKVELIPHNFDLAFLFIFPCSHYEWGQTEQRELKPDEERVLQLPRAHFAVSLVRFYVQCLFPIIIDKTFLRKKYIFLCFCLAISEFLDEHVSFSRVT